MIISRSVSVALIASMLVAAVPNISWAGDDVAPQTTVNLRAAIDRAAAQSVTKSVATTPLSKPAARARQPARASARPDGYDLRTAADPPADSPGPEREPG